MRAEQFAGRLSRAQLTRGRKSWSYVAVGQSEYALGGAQPKQRVVAEQVGDDRGGRRADLMGPAPAPRRSAHRKGNAFGRVVPAKAGTPQTRERDRRVCRGRRGAAERRREPKALQQRKFEPIALSDWPAIHLGGPACRPGANHEPAQPARGDRPYQPWFAHNQA